MTQEDKKLLLKDLCARSNYGVVVQYTAGDGSTTIDCYIDCISIRSQCVGIMENPDKPFVWRDIISIKPYLRQMTSMTKEEKDEYYDSIYDAQNDLEMSYLAIDWLNAHHFDYRGLIQMGFALEAPEDMYKN